MRHIIAEMFGHEMKKIASIAFVALLAGCVHPPSGFVIKNLDGWQRVTDDYYPTLQIEIDSEGYPSAPKEAIDAFRARSIFTKRFHEEMQKHPDEPPADLSEAERSAILAEHGIGKTVELQRVRWQIHPDAPLERVAQMTALLTKTERSEFWTTHGIFIVGAPNYGGRRLPWPGKTSIVYRVKENCIVKNGKAWSAAATPSECASKLLADLAPQSDLGLVNLYFDFSPSSPWSDAESVIDAVLPQLDGMRGLWLGVDKTGTVTLHFHDVWKKEWKEDLTSKRTVP